MQKENPRAYLYLLAHAKERVFKIGHATDPSKRTKALRDAKDYARSKMFSCRDKATAERLERMLHSLVTEYRRPRKHGGTGATEWFSEDARAKVMAYLAVAREFHGLGQEEPLPAPKKMTDAEKDARQALIEANRITREHAARREETVRAKNVLDLLDELEGSGRLAGWYGDSLVVRDLGLSEYGTLSRPLSFAHDATRFFLRPQVYCDYVLFLSGAAPTQDTTDTPLLAGLQERLRDLPALERLGADAPPKRHLAGQ